MRAVANLGTPRDAHVSLSRSLAFHHTPRLSFSVPHRDERSPRDALSLSFFLSLSRRVSKSIRRANDESPRTHHLQPPPRASPTRDATRTRRARSRSPLALARARHPSSPSRTAHRSMNSTVQTNERLLSLASSSRRTRCDAMRFDALDRACVSRSIPRSIDRPVVAECRAPTTGRTRPHRCRGKCGPARGAHPWGFRTSMYDVRDCVRSSLTIFHFPAFERVRRLSRFVVDATGGGWTGEDSREISTRW